MKTGVLNFFLTVTTAFVITSCTESSPHSSFSEGPEGISFKLNSFGENDRKADLGDYVLLKAVYKTQHDSVFWDWRYNTQKNFCIPVTDKLLSSSLFGFLINRYNEGDSLSFKVDKTLFFREMFDTIVPWFAAKDSFVIAEIRIDKIFSPQEFVLYSESKEMRAEAAQWQQKKAIEEWVEVNMKQPAAADSLLFFEMISRTKDAPVKPGTTVNLCYKGYFTDGRVFDLVKEEKPLSISFGYEGQLLPGIEKVVRRMRKGETAKIIIPSHLGFGEQGSSNGSVPAFTPVIYEVKILDVK